MLALQNSLHVISRSPSAFSFSHPQRRLFGGREGVSRDTGSESVNVSEGSFIRKKGFVVVPQGEKYAFLSFNGEVTIVDGPKRKFSMGSYLPLWRHVALPGEYLTVKYLNGTEEYLKGPAECYFNPLEHTSITCNLALHIESNQAVVIYQDTPNGVNREILHGPLSHIPKQKEWLHTFHGMVHHQKIPQ